MERKPGLLNSSFLIIFLNTGVTGTGYILGGFIAVLLLIYLIYTIIKPEKF